ncbi:MAG TPA: hypothetical protein VNA17_00670 [Pyrinomonadaceae bacterium]|nr:hypothetical protein [Pyrinomonadaceae bacterium]
MKKVVVEDVVAVREGGESTGSNAIWAVAMIIIVAILAGAVYYSGILKRRPGGGTDKIDVDVSVPAR